MPKICNIRKAGFEPVYNMEVKNVHNFAINGGLIVHNCDALRYFCSSWTFAPERPIVDTQSIKGTLCK